jgi:hypothetical protein
MPSRPGGEQGTQRTGGPIGTDSGVCSISPSDLVGYVGNLINRVKDLEQKVAELAAGNVEVNQLSDLSQQVGWVGGVTYMGVSGWTQTEYGTLIPPAGVSFSSLGFTLSDGNTYPMVVMDEDGVLQYGFTNTGQVSGASVSGRNNLILSFSQNMSSFNEYVTFDTEERSSGSSMTWAADTISLSSGLFLVSVYMDIDSWSTPGEAHYWSIDTAINLSGNSVFLVWPFGPTDSSANGVNTVVLYKSSSGTLKLRYKNSATSSVQGWINITKIG